MVPEFCKAQSASTASYNPSSRAANLIWPVRVSALKEWNADLNVMFKVAGAEMGVQGAAVERSWQQKLEK